MVQDVYIIDDDDASIVILGNYLKMTQNINLQVLKLRTNRYSFEKYTIFNCYQ